MKHALGQVIAERKLKARLSDDSESIVTIRLGSPIPSTDQIGIVAPYQIEFEGKTRTFRAVGIDGFQAMNLAMRMIEVELEALEREFSIRLRTEDNAELGVRYC